VRSRKSIGGIEVGVQTPPQLSGADFKPFWSAQACNLRDISDAKIFGSGTHIFLCASRKERGEIVGNPPEFESSST